jgi:FAD:protein FMN transferase
MTLDHSQINFFSCGTPCTILAYGTNRDVALVRAKERVMAIDDTMSAFKPDSPLNQICKNAGIAPVVIPSDLYDVLAASLELGEASQGAFDISCRPLSALWAFDQVKSTIPTGESIEKAKEMMGLKHLHLDSKKHSAYFDLKGGKLDLGGIAKGYAADEAKRILKENGVSDALINLGGNVLGLGRFNQEKPWRIGIRNPLSLKGDYFTVLEISEEAVVTSGVDEQFFIKDGKRYHHILDPRTGYPVDNGLLSVTIIGKSSLIADGLATACFVLGIDASLPLLREEGYRGIFVKNNGDVYSSFDLGNNPLKA